MYDIAMAILCLIVGPAIFILTLKLLDFLDFLTGYRFGNFVGSKGADVIEWMMRKR